MVLSASAPAALLRARSAYDTAVAAGFLRFVERPVGAIEDGVGRVRARKGRDAAGSGDGDGMVVEMEAELRDLHADLVGHDARFLRGRADEQHHEFLAAIARDEIRVAHVSGEVLPDDAQDLVARLVPVRVIDALEAVDIPREDADRPLEALPALEFLLDAIVVRGPVRNAGERVDHREALLL